METTFVQMKCL